MMMKKEYLRIELDYRVIPIHKYRVFVDTCIISIFRLKENFSFKVLSSFFEVSIYIHNSTLHDMIMSNHLMFFEFFSKLQHDIVLLTKVYEEYLQIVYLIYILFQVAYFHLEYNRFISHFYIPFITLPEIFQYFNAFVERSNSLAIKSASSP